MKEANQHKTEIVAVCRYQHKSLESDEVSHLNDYWSNSLDEYSNIHTSPGLNVGVVHRLESTSYHLPPSHMCVFCISSHLFLTVTINYYHTGVFDTRPQLYSTLCKQLADSWCPNLTIDSHSNCSSTTWLLLFYHLEQLYFVVPAMCTWFHQFDHVSLDFLSKSLPLSIIDMSYGFTHILAKMSDSQFMFLKHTLLHNKSHVKAIAINLECDRLLSAGWFPTKSIQFVS